MDVQGFLEPASSNTTTNPPLDLYRAVPVSILLAVIDFVTVFGNILVIIAVLTTRILRNVTCNYYIVSLAVSDLLLGLLVLPFSSVYEILDYWSFPSVFCVVWLSTDVLSCTASILNLLCISVDRYLAISRPLHYHNYSSPKFVFIMIAAAWVLAFLISFAPIFGFDTSGDQITQCKVAASGLFWTLYSSVGSFFLPLFVMLFLYYRIYLVAAKHSKFMKEERERYASFAQQQQEFDLVATRNLSLDQTSENGVPPNHRISRVTIVSSGTPPTEYKAFPKDSIAQVQGKKSGLMKKLRRLSKDKKAAKTLFIVMACFICCWFPFFTIYLIDGVCKEVCDIPSWTFKVFFWLGYCNSMLNPVIYAASSHDFRTAFRKILHCGRNRNTGGDQFGGAAETDHRSQLASARPTGNGLSSQPNKQRHSIASHLISKTRPAAPDSPTLNRFPAVGQNYTLVEQDENGLSPITAAGLQAGEIANAPLQQLSDPSLGRTSGPSDLSIKVFEKKNGKELLEVATPTALDSSLGSSSIFPDESPVGPTTSVNCIQKDGTSSAVMAKVKVEAKQMVTVVSDNRKPRPTERSPTVPQAKPRPSEVSDVAVTPNESEILEKCVQTSISFVDLGAI